MKTLNPSSLFVFVALTCCINTSKAQSVITGTVVGHDGKALKKSLVHFSVAGPEENATIIQPDESGRFVYHTHAKGLHFINFVGVEHQQKKVVLYVDEPRQISLNISLDPEYYADDLSQAEVRGPDTKSPFNGTRMSKQADGSYVAEFQSTDSVVQYLIVKATESGEPIAGTNADDYHIVSYGGIFSVIYGLKRPRSGKVSIVLNPRNTPGDHVEVNPFRDGRSLDAQLTEIFNEINDRKRSEAVDKVSLEQLSAKILKEKNVLMRQALWIKYLDRLFPNPELRLTTPPELIEAKIVSKALDELTPTSPFWTLRWLYPFSLLEKSIEATRRPNDYKDYAERSVENWPPQIRGWGYRDLMSRAEARKDAKEVERIYNRLQQLSPDSPAAKYEKLQRERKMAAKVVLGSEVPDFKAHALEDSTVVYTPDNIRAKFYMIDFWATWCGPCIQEFPHLQKAYEQFNHKGLEILSYSVDSNREVVERFRKERFPLPWLHAIDPQLRARESKMVRQFEVYFYPTVFLVDASGKIIAMNEDLRGEKLTELLNKLFKD